jgi:hypothetical protein
MNFVSVISGRFLMRKIIFNGAGFMEAIAAAMMERTEGPQVEIEAELAYLLGRERIWEKRDVK